MKNTDPAAVMIVNPDLFYFEVPGPYGVKGSTKSIWDHRARKIRTLPDCKHGKTFAASVQVAALHAGIKKVPKGIGVSISAIYGFIRPPRTVGRRDPCVRPDADKLARALLDALTGYAYDDDGQVIALSIRKIYAERTVARVFVMVER
jgi:Holliday junction resolvase RusA-like endonuclease